MYDSEIHHRRSIRVKGYDYAQDGAYFVTVCAHNRQNLFGEIANGEMELNEAGKMVRDCWIDLKNRFSNIEIDEFVVMPKHFHGIIVICTVGAGLVPARICSELSNGDNRLSDGLKTDNKNSGRAGTRPAPTNNNALCDIIRVFKSLTTSEYIKNVKVGKFPAFKKSVWQRNYWEHIVRDGDDLNRVREYIVNNPINWEIDELYSRIS